MARLISIDGSQGEGGGQILRTALALSAVSGQGFEVKRIRANRSQPGLRAQHLAAVRATAMACDARVGGAFEGSPDLRFEPGPMRAGSFRFEIATAGAATLVLQTVLPPLATAGAGSRVEATGGTHVPAAPTFDFLARHWSVVLQRLGLGFRLEMPKAGFYPPGGGEVVARVEPWTRPAPALVLEDRGPLVEIRGVSGAARLKGGVARRQADGARAFFWESRRLESSWEVREDVAAASPGSFLLVEAIFEGSRAAFSALGRRGVRAEVLGEDVARRVVRFLEDGDGAVDPWLADQLALPLALARGGGRATTSEVTRHLVTVVEVLGLFGYRGRTWGRVGGPGGLEVEAC